MMHDGLSAVVGYRPCFIIYFSPVAERFAFIFCTLQRRLVSKLLSTRAKRGFYDCNIQSEVSDSQGVYGGISAGPWK